MTDTQERTNPFSRRKLLAAGGGALAIVAVAGCTGNSSNTGSGIGQNVADTNDLTGQQANLTITAYNAIKDNPECQYPANLLKTSLEMQNQREKLLRMNQPTKTGWIHLFLQGVGYVGTFTVLGKVSSINSSMTADLGVYTDNANQGAGVVNAPLPGDDLSFGPNEGGDGSVFWFTAEGVYMNWVGPYLYVDTDLDVNSSLNAALVMPRNATPTSTSKG
jgi:hypothetical protein